MTPVQWLLTKAATSKPGRKVIIGVIVFALAAILFLCSAIGLFAAIVGVLAKEETFYYPLLNGSVTEPYNPNRIITHTYEVEVSKEVEVEVERQKTDSLGRPLVDRHGDPVLETVLETQTVVETEERTEEIDSPHLGVDLFAREGSYVVSSSGGTVVAVYNSHTSGQTVEIWHEQTGHTTRYAHLSATIVLAGDELIMGQPIGKVGTSGECTPHRESTPHVHMEMVDETGNTIDPSFLLQPWGDYADIPAALIQEQAGADWEDWMASEISAENVVWNGENYLWPVPGHTYINSPFGWRDLDNNGTKEDLHSGMDIPAPEGTPIYAAAPGLVSTQAHWSYGVCVKVSVNGNTINIYGHMQARAEGITDGVMVEAGQLIGYVGSTGNSSGNHLHFQVSVGGTATNPAAYFP